MRNRLIRSMRKIFRSAYRRLLNIISRHWFLLALFVVLLGIFAIIRLDDFFTEQNLLNITRTFSWIAIAALGESMVIIIGEIDLSVGAVMGLSGLVSALCMQAGWSIPPAIIIGLLTGSLVGYINGSIIGRVKLPPFIVTLAMMSIVRGATHGLSGGWPVRNLPEGFRILGQNDLVLFPLSVPLPFVFVILLAVLVGWITNYTILGRYIYTLADSEQALTISGVSVSNVKVLTYTFCGFLAATGGILMTARIGVATPTAATGYELDIIAAAIIGGTSLFGGRGSTLGVLLGATFMQVLRNGLVLFGFPAYWQNAAMGAVILLAILLDYWQRKQGWTQNRKNRTPKKHISAWKWVLVNKHKIALGLFVLTFFLITWKLTSQVEQKTSEHKTLTIAWIPKALDNPVFELGRLGAVKRAAELSQSELQVEILYAGSVTSDPTEQVRIIEDMITKKVDAIAISCNDPTACIYPINQAVEAGIPVMTWDSDSPSSRRFTYLGLDNYQAGIAAAELLVTAMGQQGEVAILTGLPGAYNLEERIRGFKDGLVYFPEIKIVATIYCDDDINQGVQVVEETMQVFPNLDGWFFTGLWPLMTDQGSMPLWETATLEGNVKTVAFDTLPVELELLKDEYLSGLVGQKYWSWGYDTVQIIYDHLINDQAYPTFISSGMDIVTSNNVDAMLEAWRTNDFSQTLPPP